MDNYLDFIDFLGLPMSPVKAYIYGLIFPKLIFGEIDNSPRFYLLAQINHSRQLPPNEGDLLEHRINLENFLKKINIDKKIQILSNSLIKYRKPDSTNSTRFSAIGFSLLFYINEDSLDSITDKIRQLITEDIRKNLLDDNLAKYFVAGTIDGRSSVDITAGFVSLDIDNSLNTKNILRFIIQDLLNLDININDRTNRSDATRNNQLRYKKESIILFLKNDSDLLLSIFRTNRIKKYILS